MDKECKYKYKYNNQDSKKLRHQVRATTTRGRNRRRQRLQEEEAERDGIFQERMEKGGNEDEDDEMFSTIEMDEVTHPQFQDPIIQRTLAHKKLIRHQSDDEKITHIIKEVLKRKERRKLTFLKRTPGSKKRTLEFYMVEGVLYAHQEGKGKGKPLLPESMVITELYRAHKITRHTGESRALENIRQRFHHLPATSVITLEELAEKALPCQTCMYRKKLTLTRGVLPYGI